VIKANLNNWQEFPATKFLGWQHQCCWTRCIIIQPTTGDAMFFSQIFIAWEIKYVKSPNYLTGSLAQKQGGHLLGRKEQAGSCPDS